MLDFYNVDDKYTAFLQAVDKKIPLINYAAYDKFLCGTVLSIGNHHYYVPISSNKTPYQTSLIVKDTNETPLASLRFCFMFPATNRILTQISIPDMQQSDPQYAALLQKEWDFCRANEASIMRKAKQIYKIGCNPNHPLYYTC